MNFNFFASSPAIPAIRFHPHTVLGGRIDADAQGRQSVIYFAAGCFWGVEKIFWQTHGVVTTATGYMGGSQPNPTYTQVCSGATGHAETVRVVYDEQLTDAATLIALFFESHDPTQVDGQGNDRGTQYRSAIWTTTPAQHDVAMRIRQAYQDTLTRSGFGPITTSIEAAPREDTDPGQFWFAEDYHQQYLDKNPGGYECHIRTGIPCPRVS